MIRLVLLAAVALSGCSDEPEFDRRAMLDSIASDVVIPSYGALTDATEMLASEAESFCADRSLERLDSVRARWADAHGAMRRTDAFAFGPAIDEPLRLAPKLDFWPVRETTIDELLAGDDPIDEGSLATAGAAARGLPVIERLLFVPSDREAALEAIDARRCEYLVAATRDAAHTAAMLRDAWQGETGFAHELTSAGAGGTKFESLHAAVSEVMSRSVFAVENAIAVRVAKPQGAMNGGTPDFEVLESRYSDRSREDVADSIRGVENVYLGRFGAETGIGLRDYVRARRDGLDEQVRAAFEGAYAALDALPGTLRMAIEGSPDEVEALKSALRALHRVLGVDVAGALAVTVTFNDTDGD